MILSLTADLVLVDEYSLKFPSIIALGSLPFMGIMYESSRRCALSMLILLMMVIAAVIPWFEEKRWLTPLYVAVIMLFMANPIAIDVVFQDSLSSSACLILMAR